MDMKAKVFFVFFFLFFAPLHGATAARRNRAVEKHLRRLNKPYLKSIKSPDGDIIDCVHISHQPAFDHPLLKNHTIQMRPSYHPKSEKRGQSEKGTKKPISQLWHVNGRCPVGTVPIRRTRREDLMRASSLNEYGRKNEKSIPRPTSASTALEPNTVNQTFTHKSNELATAFVDRGVYYGIEATLNVWNPKVQVTNEFSSSQLWIIGESNSIEFGWQVFPELYGDSNTRLFTYWTRDYYQTTGCYNMLCSGFFQSNNNITLGGSFNTISSYGADSQQEISISVWKDCEVGNWWMQIEDDVIGYWPAELFSSEFSSKGNASMIMWGGEVLNSASDGEHTTTQMGSGSFAEEGFGKASYICKVRVWDSTNQWTDPKDVATFNHRPDCYNVQLGQSDNADNMGSSYIYFGGPGGTLDRSTLFLLAHP